MVQIGEPRKSVPANIRTIGLGSFIEIGVEIRDGCQVGALSFVPKPNRLEGGGSTPAFLPGELGLQQTLTRSEGR